MALVPTVRVLFSPHPLGFERAEEHILPSTLTYDQIGDRIGAIHPQLDYAVTCDGQPVGPEAKFQSPPAGSLVTVRATAQGGGDTGKDVLRIAALAATLWNPLGFAGYVGASWLGAGVGAATWAGRALQAVGVAASFFMVSPPGTDRQRAKIDAEYWRNITRPYAPVSRIYGRLRVYPSLAAQPYVDGDTLYLLYVVGYGRLEISDIRLGDSPIGDYLVPRPGGIETGTALDGGYEVREGYSGEAARTIMQPEITRTLYGGTEDEIAENSGWTDNETYVTEPCDELTIRFYFPDGIGQLCRGEVNDSGIYRQVWYTKRINYQVRAKPFGGPDSAYHTFVNTHSEAATGEFRRGDRTLALREHFGVGAPAAYTVQVMRTSDWNFAEEFRPDWTVVKDCGTLRVQEFSALTRTDPIKQSNVATIAIKVTINDTNKEVEWDKLSCIAHSYLNRYSGGAWAVAKSANPAAAFRDVLQGSANAHAVADARLDTASLQAWSAWCDSYNYSFNAEFKEQRTIWQALQLIAAAARATPQMVGDNYGVWYDTQQSTVRQIITPGNSYNFSSTRRLPEKLHAIKAQYPCRTNDWQEIERWIFYPGYNADGSGGYTIATNLESREFFGVDNATQADRLGYYMLRVANQRLERASVSLDIENLVCTRGDLVKVQHDVPLHGKGWGRIKTITGADLAITQIVLDNEVNVDALNCKLYIRTAKGSSPWWQVFLSPVCTNAASGWTNTLTFSAAWSVRPAIGDLCQFGLPASEISHEYLVAGIVPHEDMSATLDLIEYQGGSGGVYESGTVVSYEPGVDSIPPDPAYADPPQPVILNVQTDEYVMVQGPDGTLVPQIALAVTFAATGRATPVFVQAQIRPHFEDQGAEVNWQPAGIFDASVHTINITAVEQGRLYDIRLRSQSAHSRVSEWLLHDNGGDGVYVIGKLTPPPAPAGLVRDGALLRWAYTVADSPPDFDGFEVRVHAGDSAGWDNAQPCHGGRWRTQEYPLTAFGWGSYTFYVKAVDTAGNYSTNAASLVAVFGDPTIENLKVTWNWRTQSPPWPDLHLPGEDSYRQNCYVHIPTGDLVATDPALDMSYTVSYADGALAGYEDAISEHFWEVSASGPWWKIEYRNAFDTGDAWVPWTGQLRIHGSYACWFRVTIGGSDTQARLTQFKNYIGTPTYAGIKNDFAFSVGGYTNFVFSTQLPTVATFSHVTGIVITPVSGGGYYGKIGPFTYQAAQLALCNAAGSYIGGTGNVEVRGYRWLNGPGT